MPITGKVKMPFTVAVEGNVGSGKTTFLNLFKGTYSDSTNPVSDVVEVYDELIDMWRNVQGTNLLSLIYRDPKRMEFYLPKLCSFDNVSTTYKKYR